MPTDWKDISDDEILNFEEAHTAKMARYERIMEKKTIDALHDVRDNLIGLMETIYRASQGLQNKTDKLLDLYDKISTGQSRQQMLLIVLSVVIALSTVFYTAITWQSVSAMREGNRIQQEFLELKKRELNDFGPNPPLQGPPQDSESHGTSGPG